MTVLDATDVHVRYGATHAVRGVSLQVEAGQTWCLVGPSGSGKSSLVRALVGLVPLASGAIRVHGISIHAPGRQPWRHVVQPVFQDPAAALDPRLSVGASVAEGLRLAPQSPALPADRVAEALTQVGLDPAVASRRPNELSAGQQQRVCLARALIVQPRCLVLDEPVSTLDVASQAVVLNLLCALREAQGLALVFVTHDTDVAAHLSATVAVMHEGRLLSRAP